MKTVRILCVLAWLVSTNLCFGQKPNVLFIAVDDLNNWIGCAGNEQAITPNMDKLASEGVYFSKAYCSYPLCGPSRASLMSSMYFSELNTSKLQPDDLEVQERVTAMGSSLMHTYLGKHGYKTMAVGKILHRHIPEGSVDLSGGRGSWDFVRDGQANKVKINFDSDDTMTDWGVYPHPEDQMSDSLAAQWAVERLGETHRAPFMLMVGFLRPHVPWYVPQKYFDLYDPNKLTLPPYDPNDWDDIPEAGLAQINGGYPRTEWAIENGQWRNIVHSYLASISFADTKIGEVLDALEASPYKDNTIVVLWGDHGYHMGEKNTFQKHTLWDRSGVAPLIIKAPKMATNATCNSVVSLLDIYPTLVDLCALPANDKLRGRSLKPILEDPNYLSDAKSPAEPNLIWDHPAVTYKKNHGAVQYGDLRYIKYDDGSQELYNHANDPNEWTNLVGDPNYADAIIALEKMFPFDPNPKK
ncbi:sulfatase [Planctomycetota bacterium]